MKKIIGLIVALLIIIIIGIVGVIGYFGYDFYDYFKAIYANDYRALKKVDTKLNFNLVGVPQKFEDYAKKIVWYGRRGGQIIVSDISYME